MRDADRRRRGGSRGTRCGCDDSPLRGARTAGWASLLQPVRAKGGHRVGSRIVDFVLVLAHMFDQERASFFAALCSAVSTFGE